MSIIRETNPILIIFLFDILCTTYLGNIRKSEQFFIDKLRRLYPFDLFLSIFGISLYK